jgi:RHS repeat-associated protein
VSFTSPAAQRWNVSAGSGNVIGAGATIAGASPNTTIAATLGSSDHWAMGGIAVKPVGGSGFSAAWEFASFHSPGEELHSNGPQEDIERVVKAQPRQVKGLRMQLSLLRETGAVWRSYYFAGAARIAMREDSDAGSEVIYLFGDHLGSTSLTYRASDQHVDRQWYKPWGEVRQVTGEMPTDYQYTGQRSAGWGLYHFKARWFDSNLGRFAQADTIIPTMGFSIAWDRYAGMTNNPIRFSDPTGHRPDDGCRYEGCSGDPNIIIHMVMIGALPAIQPWQGYQSYAENSEQSWYYPTELTNSVTKKTESAASKATNYTNAMILANDVTAGIRTSKYINDPKEIFVWAIYEEYPNSINVIELKVRNNTNVDISVVSAYISATNNSCVGWCLPDQVYQTAPPRITNAESRSIGVISAHESNKISLVPSGYTENQMNEFPNTYNLQVRVSLGYSFDNNFQWPAISKKIR